MKQSTSIIIIVCVIIGLIGTGGGYAAGYAIYEPKVRSYEVQAASLGAQLATLERAIANQETSIAILESAKSKLETDLSGVREETARYQQQVTGLQAEVSSLQAKLGAIEPEVSALEKRLTGILGINVTQGYQWIYQGTPWQWDLPIPLSLYVEYRERPRPESAFYWVEMAKDPGDDLYIDRMIEHIESIALEGNFSAVEKLNFVIAFVQGLPYTVDEETTPYDEYPRYPIETIFDRGGDCEDTSLLVAALLDRMGYDVALLLLREARHMAVGVALAGGSGSYYLHNGKKYFYLETTGEGWQIGELPSSITDSSAQVYPLRS
ncbi:MAG: hypothetical protein Q8Q07_05765 [Dehalococcoidales bacterium]|nr:hypothetical protein [Dehalococcoidales bacterium]